jgi:Holliday junction resolvase RusA-like endonuclease
MTETRVVIPGHPAPKGSLKCIGGRGGKGHVLIEDNARTKPWRKTLATWAGRRLQPVQPQEPIGVEITFTLERPKSHYGTGRNAGVLRPGAPAFPVSHATGDVDKLLRLALDALQDAKVLPDDCQVIETTARKVYVSPAPIDDPWSVAYDALGHPGVVLRLYPIVHRPFVEDEE